MESMNNAQKMAALQQRLFESKKLSIYIGRVPVQTKEAFEKLAHEEFCDDFGFTLKWIMEEHEQFIALAQQLEQHEQRIAVLEAHNNIEKAPTEKAKEKRMIDGSIKKIGGET